MVPLSSLAGENLNFSFEPLTLHDALDNEREETWLHWLLDKIIRAVSHRLYRTLDGSIGGDDHDGEIALLFRDRGQGFETVHIGQLDIEESHLRTYFIQEFQALFTGQSRNCSEAQRFQPVFQNLLD